ncbi:MAG: Ethanolamine utilization protein EutN [Chloroflexi bacterium ADurb.Bin180]|nr:MAG: Ethanolamine utilization protein EutN [Chloroflexi bacterium ADurb.Bin180]HNR95978.1 EutN/CcmL family microcompartment protein [Anaerolineae bacterium]HQJ50943.1 EutN/CcmL family microcompartment protein [Anaerolineae bacterium]
MYLGKVVGNLVSVIKHKDYVGLKLLVVQPIHPDGRSWSDPLICVDMVDSGIGDTVLYLDEGNSARQLLELGPDSPVRPVIVGVLDELRWRDDAGVLQQRYPNSGPR